MVDDTVRIDLDSVKLDADLALPTENYGLVAFAHGSGSSRHSPRNRQVAESLLRCGLGTLLADLLTPEEDERDHLTREYRFDIPLLATRLTAIVDWLVQRYPAISPIGLFGASTGAAAALITAAERPSLVRAVVSRGGRVDLAESSLPHVEAPTLFIVGEYDAPVLEANRRMQASLQPANRLHVVPEASHLFEEPDALEQVAEAAAAWFARYLHTGVAGHTEGADSADG